MIEIIRPDYLDMEMQMNRNRQENQGFFPAEPNRIVDLLKEHDDNLQVLYNAKKHKWRIVDHTWHCIMQVDSLDSKTVDHIKSIDCRTGYRAMDRIREVEEQIEAEQEKKLEDMAYWMAKDLKKPLQYAHDYGRV